LYPNADRTHQRRKRRYELQPEQLSDTGSSPCSAQGRNECRLVVAVQ
jgi:hypothetical protein